MKVAVTGATGFVGTALCAGLAQRGDQVVALSRDPDRARSALPDAAVLGWGGGSGTVLPAVDAVVHLAGESVGGRWTAAKKRRIRESRVEGTRCLVDAIGRAEPKPAVLVSASAVGYYGNRGEEKLTEASPPAYDFLGQVCQAWEAEARRAEEWGVRVVSLRLGVVLDRGGGAFAQLLTPFRLGIGGPFGNGQQWFPWVHRADVVGLFLYALEKSEAAGPLNVAAPGIVRNGEFARALGKALHRPAFVPLPAFALRLLLGEFGETLLASQHVLPERPQALGYAFRHPQLEPALAAILGDRT